MSLDLLAENLVSPLLLFFLLGVAAAVLRSDLSVPESLTRSIAIYLLVAIGFKGGVAISNAGLGAVWLPTLAAMDCW